jgi:hypothetical protein
MESVIARLLSDSESGKLTQRQLVQTIAFVAVGSPVATPPYSALVAQSTRRPITPIPSQSGEG